MAVSGGDRLRQMVVTVAEVFCVVGTLVGVGVLGTSVDQTAGGALAADATLLAPAGTAFSIWSVVYAGLAAYTVWQWLPAQVADPRVRQTGWLAAASMVLNASWLLVTQQGWIWVSVLVILALAATLLQLVRRLDRGEPRSRTERVVLDGTFGLYLGWVCVAVCANVAAALTDSGLLPDSSVRVALAVAVLGLVARIGVVLALRLGARLSVGAAIAWGLVWIAVGRATDEPASDLTAVAAVVAAVVVLVATVGLAVRGSRAPSRAISRVTSRATSRGIGPA